MMQGYDYAKSLEAVLARAVCKCERKQREPGRNHNKVLKDREASSHKKIYYFLLIIWCIWTLFPLLYPCILVEVDSV